MITILNRKELLVTYDIKLQADIRQLLSMHGIEYTTKVCNHKAHRKTFGSFCKSAEYIIYVKKEDYLKATYLLNHQK